MTRNELIETLVERYFSRKGLNVGDVLRHNPDARTMEYGFNAGMHGGFNLKPYTNKEGVSGHGLDLTPIQSAIDRWKRKRPYRVNGRRVKSPHMKS